MILTALEHSECSPLKSNRLEQIFDRLDEEAAATLKALKLMPAPEPREHACPAIEHAKQATDQFV
jgi:hypothetical protein